MKQNKGTIVPTFFVAFRTIVIVNLLANFQCFKRAKSEGLKPHCPVDFCIAVVIERIHNRIEHSELI